MGQATAPPATVDRAAREREQLAWRLLWTAFAFFCAIVVLGVVGVAWYRQAALTPRYASIQIIRGTVLGQTEEAVKETVIANGTRLQDGDRVRTASDGQALVSLPDGSNILLWPDSAIQVKQLRTSTYTNSRGVTVVAHTGGHVRVEVAVPSTLERRFEIQTPHSRALLREGSYRIEVGPARTELAVRAGSASVTAREQTVEVLRREQTVVSADSRPAAPFAAARNLVRNGDFTRGFEGWSQGSRNEEDNIAGQVSLVDQEGRYAVRMRRQGSQKHGESFLQQPINRDVTDEVSLKLTMDVKVVNQTLSGGGWLGSEYPLLVRLRYRDAYGSENTVVRGFYVKNDEGRPTPNGTLVPANQWLPVTIDLFDDRQVTPRPAQLLWIEIEGSGWDYESFVTGIQLMAE